MVSMKNGDRITAGHLKISLYIVGGLFGALISLVVFIYFDSIERQEQRDIQQDKFYDELLNIANSNTISADAIKKYILIRDGIDLDGVIRRSEWDRLIKEFESNPRGAEIIQPTEKVYADR